MSRVARRVAATSGELFAAADLTRPADPAPPPVDVEPPPSPLTATQPLAVREVLGFCPRLLSALPAPATLVCDVVGGWTVAAAHTDRVVITTSQAVYAEASKTWPTFTGSELAAMALAAEHDRGSPAALAGWCAAKRDRGPDWRLTAAAAIGPVAGRFEPLGWSIGEVFARLGLGLLAVGVGDEVPGDYHNRRAEGLDNVAE